ncbi:hypothetical protein LMTR13_08750 [Bradyrhizobium icense]|uniref:Uncharacterized protein n=2 Tax=Bradyrhizobium icense TaxID=1274631 RepID=A0A1B1UBV6_9BRAD|nr:hypothetical protein LMTR13_08750 [Bradyrhizobium icense]
MNNVAKRTAFGALLVLPLLDAATAEGAFKLSNCENISCSRDLKRGKLRISSCSSYAYLFNTNTSKYFRCDVSLAVVRDAKEVITVQTDGYCARKMRVFQSDSSYDLGFAETAPPSTNSFFGHGGFSAWAADTTHQKVRGCITIAAGPGGEVARCLDMTFK